MLPAWSCTASGVFINHRCASKQGSGTGPCGDGVFDFGEPLFKEDG